MILTWAGTQIGFTPNNLRFSWGHSSIKNEAGFVVGLKGFCNVPEAYLYMTGATDALGQANAKVQMDALFAQSKNTVGDLKFLNDDGSDTTTVQYVADSEGQMVTWDSLEWSNMPGAQYSTFRAFSCSFSWRLNLLSSYQRANLLVDWSEEITVEGGLSQFVSHLPVNSTTVEQQITSSALLWFITQTGSAEGYSFLPAANLPVYNTTPPLKRQSVKANSGKRVGQNAIVNRMRSWNYYFELASPTPPTPSVTLWTAPF